MGVLLDIALQAEAAIADDDDGIKPRPSDHRVEKVIGKLQANPGRCYAMESHLDADPDAVILTLAIRGKGTCELRIPKSRYDAIALLELFEKHTVRETLQ